MLIINHGIRYEIQDDAIPKTSLLRVMLDTNVGITKDNNGYIILDDVPSNAFKAYVSFLSFNVNFEWNEDIAGWFDYLGHNNKYEYPLDYWKIKLIDEHDVEFRYLSDIDRIQYLVGDNAIEFIEKYATKIDNGMINVYGNNTLDDDVPRIYYTEEFVIARYISIYTYFSGTIWFDYDKVYNDEYISILLWEVINNNFKLLFPMLPKFEDDMKLILAIENIYSREEYDTDKKYFITSTLDQYDMIDVEKYGWKEIFNDNVYHTENYMIEELLADYIDRTEGTTLDKIKKYNEGDKYKIRTELLYDQFDYSDLFQLAKNICNPYYNSKYTVRNQMLNIEKWDPSKTQHIYVEYEYYDPMSIMLLVSRYGFDMNKLLPNMIPIPNNITIEEFYNMSPLINKKSVDRSNNVKNNNIIRPIVNYKYNY